MKRRKKATSIIFVLALLVVFSSNTVSAAIPRYRSPRINDVIGSCSSNAYKTTPNATTVYKGGSSSISVSSTCYYIKPSTRKITSKSTAKGGQPSQKSVNFQAPRSFETYEIISTHRISAAGEKWSAQTRHCRLK